MIGSMFEMLVENPCIICDEKKKLDEIEKYSTDLGLRAFGRRWKIAYCKERNLEEYKSIQLYKTRTG